jgi:hypothetical protein
VGASEPWWRKVDVLIDQISKEGLRGHQSQWWKIDGPSDQICIEGLKDDVDVLGWE